MRQTVIKAAGGVALASALVLPATMLPATAGAAPDGNSSNTLAGKTIFLDPGHQGTNHSENLSRQVDDGRGGTKDCQTTGMTSLGGVAEHTINWQVSQLAKTALESLGAKVVLSRNDDSGWGGCVDERAKAASNSGADVAVSIHADSTPPAEGARDHGFHLIVPTLPIPDPKVNEVQSGNGLALSKSVRDAYLKNGFTTANYAGVVDGLQTRSDIAGPALTTVPLAFVEMGNGANPDDAKVLESPDGQLKNAVAITTGIVGYLLGTKIPGVPVKGTPPSSSTPATTTSPSPSSTQSTPKAATPKTSTPSTTTTPPSGTEKSSSMLDTAIQLLKPLLAALGLDGLADSNLAGLASNLASKLLDIALNSGG